MGSSEGRMRENQKEDLTPFPILVSTPRAGAPLPQTETLLYTQIYNSLQVLQVFLVRFSMSAPQI